MASHSFSMARSSGNSGNTVAAQEGMGTEAMHQGKPLLIWSRSKTLRMTEPDFCARTRRSGSTPFKVSGSLAAMAR